MKKLTRYQKYSKSLELHSRILTKQRNDGKSNTMQYIELMRRISWVIDITKELAKYEDVRIQRDHWSRWRR